MKRAGEANVVRVRGRTLGSVRRDLERWRSDPARPWRIPETLWGAAVEAAVEHGVSKTSRELGLDYYALEKRVQARPRIHVPTASDGFVEVVWPTSRVAPECSIEVSDGAGARLRVELRGSTRAEVEALARALWSATR